MTVGGVWKIADDLPAGQPMVAEPLINQATGLGAVRKRWDPQKGFTNETSDDFEIREGSTSTGCDLMPQQRGFIDPKTTYELTYDAMLQRTVICNRKEGTPAGWIPFRESLIVVLGESY